MKLEASLSQLWKYDSGIDSMIFIISSNFIFYLKTWCFEKSWALLVILGFKSVRWKFSGIMLPLAELNESFPNLWLTFKRWECIQGTRVIYKIKIGLIWKCSHGRIWHQGHAWRNKNNCTIALKVLLFLPF